MVYAKRHPVAAISKSSNSGRDETLLHSFPITCREVSAVYLAGGFGD